MQNNNSNVDVTTTTSSDHSVVLARTNNDGKGSTDDANAAAASVAVTTTTAIATEPQKTWKKKKKKIKPPRPEPTYESSEASEFYQTAKALLQSGDFETALKTIVRGIGWTKNELTVVYRNDPEHDVSLHESYAPFHYLYGTTLLYSIEESADEMQPLTTMEGAALGTVPEDIPVEEDDQEPERNGTDAAQELPPEDSVEDMEIAWENLETARTILEKMLTTSSYNAPRRRADLAQVLLREGDLQRQNGAYTSAVTDYTACLSYYQNNPGIAPFSRKIADVHCNLGAVYFHLVVETNKGSTAADGTTISERDRPAKVIFYRNRGFYHYYECAKTLAGMISEFFRHTPTYESFQLFDRDYSRLFPSFDERSEEYPTFIRNKLTAMRQVVTQWVTTENMVGLSMEDMNLIQDSTAVLEEIQETLDEAESSEQGVVEATAMKEEIAAMVASQLPPNGDNGPDALTPHQTSSSNAFGSAAAAASTAAAQPIHMVVKKKKKRTEEELMDEEGMDVKLPAKENGHEKRVKTNE